MFILFAVGFNHLLRYAQGKGSNICAIGAIQATVAAGVCGIGWALHANGPLGWQAPVFGAIGGIGFGIGFLTLNLCIRFAGVAIAQVAGRLSIAIPMAVALLVWGERLTLLHAIGIGLIFVAMPLMAHGDAIKPTVARRWKVLVLCAQFVITGILGVAFHAFGETDPRGAEIAGKLAFLMFAAAGAAIILIIAAAGKGVVPTMPEVAYGVALGLINVFANFGILLALAALDAIVVFPVTSVGTIVVSAFSSMILWGERYRGKVLWGMILAAFALVLIKW